MKKIYLLVLLSFLIQPAFAQQKAEIKQWLVTKTQQVNLPAFADVKNVDGETFEASNLINTTQIDDESLNWNTKSINDDSLLFAQTSKNNLFLLKSYLSVNRWTKGTLNLTLNCFYEVFIDGEPVKTKNSADANSNKIQLELNRVIMKL